MKYSANQGAFQLHILYDFVLNMNKNQAMHSTSVTMSCRDGVKGKKVQGKRTSLHVAP